MKFIPIQCSIPSASEIGKLKNIVVRVIENKGLRELCVEVSDLKLRKLWVRVGFNVAFHLKYIAFEHKQRFYNSPGI